MNIINVCPALPSYITRPSSYSLFFDQRSIYFTPRFTHVKHRSRLLLQRLLPTCLKARAGSRVGVNLHTFEYT